MNKMKCILILLAMLCTFYTYAQDGEYLTVRDLESWSIVSLKYKVKPNLSFAVQEQLRLKNNSSQLDASVTELNTGFGLIDNIYGAIGLRYYRENDTQGDVQGFENHIRVHFDLGYNYEKERLNIEYRLRWQSKNELGISKDEGDYPNKYLRLKLGLKYNIKNWKLDPEFSSELFRHYETGEATRFDKYRLTLGTKYKIKGYGKIGVFYRVEKELNGTYPKTTNVIGLKYSYTLKSNTKKVQKKESDDELIWY